MAQYYLTVLIHQHDEPQRCAIGNSGRAGVLRPGKTIWLRASIWILGLFVMVTAAASACAYFVLYAGAYLTGTDANHPSQVPGIVRSTGLIAASCAALGSYGFAVRRGERRKVNELSCERVFPQLALGVALGFAAMAVSVGILWIAGWIQLGFRMPSAISVPIGYTVASGTIEEILFRLILFRLLWRVVGAWPALIASMIIFGAIHLSNPEGTWLGALGTAVEGGLLSAGLYMLTGRAWASIAEHSAWNFTQGWIFGATVSGLGGIAGGPMIARPAARVPDIVSGGIFGPEGSFVTMIVSALVGGTSIWLAWTSGRMSKVWAESSSADQNGNRLCRTSQAKLLALGITNE